VENSLEDVSGDVSEEDLQGCNSFGDPLDFWSLGLSGAPSWLTPSMKSSAGTIPF
jgi:hypothetical protein